ncbi:hypothetical protein LCGC14_1047930 [marine sediment metagenome]|uniref:Uncharacterized protein n=1 Tax=marine sediment metagenome TaxID=412755 RepID=A0A0F9NBJ5_9ZZZZ
MARHWAPLRDPNKPETRSRSISRVGTSADQWGQRPMFSEPGEDQLPPDQGNMGYEGRPDDIHPSDGRKSADGVADFRVDEAGSSVTVLPVSTDNVLAPPTDAQITAAFGADKPDGFVGIINDNGSSVQVWLCVRTKAAVDAWWYEQLTKAT